MSDEKAIPKTDYKLEADSELRFEIENKNEKVTVVLLNGQAELFGTEVVVKKPYEFVTGAKVAIYTYHGCTLELRGKPDVAYVAKETPMVMYLNANSALEHLRNKAEQEDAQGPIVMVVGPMDVGKTTLCRIFLNYAVRLGRRPIFVDLDVGQGGIAIPGTIGALLVERPAPVAEGFSQQAPLVYHYGHSSPSSNSTFYDVLISKLAETTLERLQANKKAKSSGMIINTCGWVKGSGYSHILHTVSAFEVTAIFVLDQERLYNELLRDVKRSVQVVFLPKSGGVVERTRSQRTEARDQRIREYFYGSKMPLFPHSFDVKFGDIKIFKVGSPPLPDSCLPLGMKAEDNYTKLVAVQPGPQLLHHILAVSFAESPDENVIQTNVAGFICVTNVNMDKQVLTVLSPQPRPLPQTILLVSDLQFMDSH
ncbi:protein CLP1 homolog [Anopheles ziemanni]|uniref:Protein CLP1 homolog n=1 Tax=Anopheles sinensis TaxID=74873 RepID=A0A084VF65_ANOSI|nr:protein CLP1 homolog [Anopheles coustani]XP_058167062.1 protein CLP1 homolog [Anopheles ziemanni]KFB36609.1 AGAP007701-PA-like protein [Anopheles sinensis]